MSATCVWTACIYRTNVTVTRWEGPDLPDGHWEARVCGTGATVFVRPEDLESAFTITVGRGGAA